MLFRRISAHLYTHTLSDMPSRIGNSQTLLRLTKKLDRRVILNTNARMKSVQHGLDSAFSPSVCVVTPKLMPPILREGSSKMDIYGRLVYVFELQFSTGDASIGDWVLVP